MRISVGVLLLGITQFATAADDYPVRPVRWIVPAPPGGKGTIRRTGRFGDHCALASVMAAMSAKIAASAISACG